MVIHSFMCIKIWTTHLTSPCPILGLPTALQRERQIFGWNKCRLLRWLSAVLTTMARPQANISHEKSEIPTQRKKNSETIPTFPYTLFKSQIKLINFTGAPNKTGVFFVLFTPTASPKVCSHHSASAPAQTLSLAGLKSAAYFFPGKKTSLAALPGDCGSTSRGSRVIHVLNPVRIVTKTDQIRPPEVETDKASWGQELSAVPKEACIWTV